MAQSPLYPIHQQSNAVFNDRHGWEIPLHYGNPSDEYLKTNESVALIDLSHWCVFSVTGPDRKTFVHGMLSNEVNKLHPGEGNYSLFLTPKGKIAADFILLENSEEIILIAKEPVRKTAFEGLNKYLIMEDAAISDQTDEKAILCLLGPKSLSILTNALPVISLPDAAYHFANLTYQDCECLIVNYSATGLPGYLIVAPNECAEPLWRKFVEQGASPAGMNAFDAIQMEAGIPQIGKELDDTVIPQEAALHHALSFEKGCYIGQEVVARLHFRGHVNRELTGFALEADSPLTTASLIQNDAGKTIGKITSSMVSEKLGQVIGLGYMACAFRKPGAMYTAMGNEKSVAVTVHDLPF